MRNVYTVGQVNVYIKNMFAQDYMLCRIAVKGEVSNCKYHSSGHIYFSLKDESGVLSCIMFAGKRGGLAFTLQEGQQVVVLGNVAVYERDGKYQLYANEIVLDGMGALYEQFEALKKKLLEMGMFAQEYKRPIPFYARRIGIVTAKTGAAIQDICNIAARRNPYVQLILFPAKVQGEGAAESIVRGIRKLEVVGVDLIIVGRGGGSIEELWAFNEEIVAQAIFHCGVPVISAVGHETDTTIADYVADLRAPTPSAAAELAVCEYQELLERLRGYQMTLERLLHQKVKHRREQLAVWQMRLFYLHPNRKLQEQRTRAIRIEEQMRQGIQKQCSGARGKLSLLAEKLKGVSPMEKLQGGYAYVEKMSGEHLCSIAQAKEEETIRIHVADGILQARILEKQCREKNSCCKKVRERVE